MFAAVTVATACLLEGLPAAAVAMVGESALRTLGIEHPTGVTECVIELDAAGAVAGAGMLRTARKLFEGRLFAGD